MEIKGILHGNRTLKANNEKANQWMIRGYKLLDSRMINIKNMLIDKYPALKIFRGFRYYEELQNQVCCGGPIFLVTPEKVDADCTKVYFPHRLHSSGLLKKFKDKGIIKRPEYIIGAEFLGGPYVKFISPSIPQYKEDYELAKHLLDD